MTVSQFWQVISSACLLLVFSLPAQAIETVYPGGSDLVVDYTYSDTIMAPTDTLTITRRFINNEDFGMQGLYLSDWLPRGFQLVSQSTSKNGVAIPAIFTADSSGALASNAIGYYWDLDLDGLSTNQSIIVSPEDTIVLVAKFICPTTGTYQLPMHSLVCYAEGVGGFFTTSTAQRITVQLSSGDEDDGGGDTPLPSAYLLSTAFPNPFNATVSINYSGQGLASSQLELVIYNSLGQEVYARRIISEGNEGLLRWTPDASSATGLYFYRLISTAGTSAGKMVLLK